MKKFLEHSRHCISLVFIAAVALGISACGDADILDVSGDADQKASNADIEVVSYKELPSCSDGREDETAYVFDQNQGYVCSKGEWVEYDSVWTILTDPRDGHIYRIVTIGNQVWMAENLNFKIENSSCYKDDPGHCTKYGRLYAWTAAMEACPDGWHLPSKAEFDTLLRVVGGQSTAGKMLKSITSHWNNCRDCIDAYSFSVLPAGYKFDKGDFQNKGDDAYFWSSTEVDSLYSYGMHLDDFHGNVVLLDKNLKYRGFSARCVKGKTLTQKSSSSVKPKSSSSKKSSSSATSKSSSSKTSSSSVSSSSRKFLFVDPSTVVTGSMTDSRDGKTYKTVTIGTQTWMAENLNYATPLSICYEDDESYCDKYGRFYYPDGGICPSGWHLPSSWEWDGLIVAVGGNSIAGKMLKSTSGWLDGQNGTDAYGFSAMPGGSGSCRFLNALCESSGEGYIASFWQSACPDDVGINHCYGVSRSLVYNLENVNYHIEAYGAEDRVNSVRCVKDESSIMSSSSKKIASSSSVSSKSQSSSTPSTVVFDSMTDSRDGQTYKTVTIGSQIWMAENLNYETENSYCYKDSAEYCAKYGRLYTWAAAMDSVGEFSTNGKGCGYDHGLECNPVGIVRGVCPEGWHLPMLGEFRMLYSVVDASNSSVGKMLNSTSGWYAGGNGSDDYGFSVLPSGYKNYNGNYSREGYFAFFWNSSVSCDWGRFSSEMYPCEQAYYESFDFYGFRSTNTVSSNYAFSVRCVNDESLKPKISVTKGIMTDSRDGQTYKTVKIDGQTWLAENLNYKNQNSSCYNDFAEYCAKYGRLYTWAAAKEACPVGWHLPSKSEFETLISVVGGEYLMNIMLMSASGWSGIDAYSFSALPAGSLNSRGEYGGEGYDAYFWSSTDGGSKSSYVLQLNKRYYLSSLSNSFSKDNKYSVRCVKD